MCTIDGCHFSISQPFPHYLWYGDKRLQQMLTSLMYTLIITSISLTLWNLNLNSNATARAHTQTQFFRHRNKTATTQTVLCKLGYHRLSFVLLICSFLFDQNSVFFIHVRRRNEWINKNGIENKIHRKWRKQIKEKPRTIQSIHKRTYATYYECVCWAKNWHKNLI